MSHFKTKIQLHIENLDDYIRTRTTLLTLRTPDGLLEIPEVGFDQNLRDEDMLIRRELFDAAKRELSQISKLPAFSKIMQTIYSELDELVKKRENEIAVFRKNRGGVKIKTTDGFFVPDSHELIEKKRFVCFQTKHLVAQYKRMIWRFIGSKHVYYVGSTYDFKTFKNSVSDLLVKIALPDQEKKIVRLLACFKPATQRPKSGDDHTHIYEIFKDDVNRLSGNKIRLKVKEQDFVKETVQLSEAGVFCPLKGFLDRFHSELFLVQDIDPLGDAYNLKFYTPNIRGYRSVVKNKIRGRKSFLLKRR